ncbi:methyl-accepting chemotaxis protein [Kiloniella laminariae]|uniref:Methyl-accepting chemotaxis protein n=1 Tax=Kiloniella laminariae TaxID=454162 RepID=A0ABT4LK50_9PROT|nr:methyl-accepting chemotaxis protein [Kiloniella laminariae]MCZ4281485.1 methyl-accepting chemotaxis protein [Kiloniella laminariae]
MTLNIGSRILAAAALIVVVTFSAFIIYFDFNQSDSIQASLKSKLSETGNLATASISNWVVGRQILIENVGQNIAINSETESVKSIVDRSVLQKNFMFTYFGSATGEMIMSPPDELPDGYDPRKRPWYIDAIAAKASTLTEPYEDASTGNLIVTLATPVLNGSQIVGTAGGDIEITVLGDIVRSVDLGGIGYGFLVNDQGTVLIHRDKEFTLRPMSEVFPESTPTINTDLANIDAGSGDQMFAFFPIEGLPSVKWYLGFAIDRDAAFANLTKFRLTASITALISVLAIMGLLGVLVRLWVSQPVLTMTGAMTSLADGNLDVPIPGSDKTDEIGQMAAAVLVFKNNAVEIERLARENEQTAERMATERRNALHQMASSFEQTVLSIVETVAQASQQTQTVAKKLSASAEESNARAIAVSNAATETTANVQTVAAATEELSAAIREIGMQVTQSIQVASEAVEGVGRTNTTVTNLAEAAQRIGEVVNMIQDVAGQTNLLALNATIEAARAGDAGKGFAVVASEVKALANQTDKATGDIQTQVEGIQSSSSLSVQEITQISKTIGRINEFANAIAAAIEEQSAATQEIASSVQKAAAGTQEVSSNVAAVTDTSTQVSTEAKHLLDSSSEMQALAENLRSEVKDFLATVRAS